MLGYGWPTAGGLTLLLHMHTALRPQVELRFSMQMIAVSTPENAATLYDEVAQLPGTPTTAQLHGVRHCCTVALHARALTLPACVRAACLHCLHPSPAHCAHCICCPLCLAQAVGVSINGPLSPHLPLNVLAAVSREGKPMASGGGAAGCWCGCTMLCGVRN